MMNMLRGLYHFFKHPDRWRKYSKLHTLSRKKRQRDYRVHRGDATVEEILNDSSDRDLEELCSLVLKDTDCLAVLLKFNGSAKTLRELFWELCRAGSGQWAENLYIPYVALAEPWALEYLLRRRSQSASLRETAFRVLVFYQDGKSIAWLNAEQSRT